MKHTVFYKSERKMFQILFLQIYHYISVVTVPKCLYLVPIPVKIHGFGTNFGTKAKHKNMRIKKHTIFINEVKQNVIYKNQCHFLCLFKIVFQVIKVW